MDLAVSPSRCRKATPPKEGSPGQTLPAFAPGCCSCRTRAERPLMWSLRERDQRRMSTPRSPARHPTPCPNRRAAPARPAQAGRPAAARSAGITPAFRYYSVLGLLLGHQPSSSRSPTYRPNPAGTQQISWGETRSFRRDRVATTPSASTGTGHRRCGTASPTEEPPYGASLRSRPRHTYGLFQTRPHGSEVDRVPRRSLSLDSVPASSRARKPARSTPNRSDSSDTRGRRTSATGERAIMPSSRA